MCCGYMYVFTGQNLRKFLRFNADSNGARKLGTDVFPHVGRHMGNNSQG
jgi:hypothetical protein